MEQKIIILKNKECNGFEIYPNGQLTDSDVADLQADGWRWHKIKKCYYALATKKRYELIKKHWNDIEIVDNTDKYGQYYKQMETIERLIKNLSEMAQNIKRDEDHSKLDEILQHLEEIKNAKMPF